MKKNIINRFIVATLVVSALLIGNNSAAQAKSFNQNPSNSYTTVSKSNTVQALDPNWGLGTHQTEYVSNNRSYDWYIDQGNTGYASNNNCGPSCATMALKWFNPNFNLTVEDARNTYPENGNWWYTNDITNYFNLNNMKKYVTKENVTTTLLKNQLKQGNIAILCIKASYIPYNENDEERVGRFYNYDGGHFIIVKGYRVVDGKTYFEAYDSNNWNEEYQNGQPKGKDRYYLSTDLINAASNWWNYAIIIQAK